MTMATMTIEVKENTFILLDIVYFESRRLKYVLVEFFILFFIVVC